MEIQNILGYLLNTSARLIKRAMDEQLKEYEITTSQWAVLKLLDSRGQLTQAEIAEKLNSDRATAGSVIFRLVDKGLITKQMDLKDRRANVVSLTPQTKLMVKNIEQCAINVSTHAVRGLNEDEINLLQHSLKRIIHNLSEGVQK